MALDLKHIRLRAIAAGLATDIGGTIATWYLCTFVLGVIAGARHMTLDELTNGTGQGPIFQSLFFVNGMMFSCAGALVTSLLSQPHAVLNALLFGILTTLAGICLFSVSYDIPTVLGVIIVPPMSVLVGFVVSRWER